MHLRGVSEQTYSNMVRVLFCSVVSACDPFWQAGQATGAFAKEELWLTAYEVERRRLNPQLQEACQWLNVWLFL